MNLAEVGYPGEHTFLQIVYIPNAHLLWLNQNDVMLCRVNPDMVPPAQRCNAALKPCSAADR